VTVTVTVTVKDSQVETETKQSLEQKAAHPSHRLTREDTTLAHAKPEGCPMTSIAGGPGEREELCNASVTLHTAEQQQWSKTQSISLYIHA
jgi:hypothetical protein